VKSIPIHSIKIGERHRKQMGDLTGLADSIHEHGLLQPIGVTKDRTLVFGERRLRACRDILHWDEIPARIVDVASIVEGEFTENQVRKDFTPSERVAIGKAIEELIGSRQGKRPDDQLRAISPEVKDGDRPRDIAAKAAGFGGATTYREAKKVVDEGVPELLAAMDAGDVSVSAAAKLANLPAAEQAAAVEQPKEQLSLIAKDAAKQTKEKGEGKDPPYYVTLTQWNAMHERMREQQFNRPAKPNASFHKQTNDLIDWAQWSWNPITGCLHDCPYCYARDIANRFYEHKFEPTLHPDRLFAPRFTRVPAKAADDIRYKNVFTGSMADIFGRWTPVEWIEAVLREAREAPQWNFLFLTKFPKRMSEFKIPKNAWMGTTVDCQARVANAERAFEKVDCSVRWLSVEPLIEPLKFKRLDLFDWIVIGGASESSQTPAWHPPLSWVEDLEGQAAADGCRVYRKPNLFAPRREMPWDSPRAQRERAPDSFHYLGRKTGEMA
jgi:protein gp37/ParB-like chromosome segregation protein Spo0J